MAAVADNLGEAAVANGNNNLVVETSNSESKEFNVQKLVDMFTKLNPLAKEFFPSYYHHNPTKTDDSNQVPLNEQGNENYSNRRRRNNYNQGKRKLNGKAFRAERDDSIRRTVYVSDIDQTITEEQLAGLFSNCGQVVDCRVCGDPHSVLRFAFVEFADEEGARAALNLGGTMLGFYPVRVLPSKTAILPVNPTFLPRSEDEREMCTRTVYCTNIDKKVSQAEVKNFFESSCGEVTRLRLLGDNVHSTRIAFVEFVMLMYFHRSSSIGMPACESHPDILVSEFAAIMADGSYQDQLNAGSAKDTTAESAIVALNCSGMVLGTQPIRVSPSKTPVRPRVTRPTSR